MFASYIKYYLQTLCLQRRVSCRNLCWKGESRIANDEPVPPRSENGAETPGKEAGPNVPGMPPHLEWMCCIAKTN